MKINDALSKILQENTHSKRVNIWLWFYLESQNFQLDQSHFNTPEMRNFMANLISSNTGIDSDIRHCVGRDLLPDEMFEWIENEERQCQWLVSYLNKSPNIWLKNYPVRLIKRDLVIAMIDTLRLDLSSKKSTIDVMKNSWNHQINDDKPLLWFKRENEELKCDLAWKWIVKNGGINFLLQPNSIQSHQELLIYFDRMEFSIEKKLLCLNFVKKSWSQQKYRNNLTGKKQYNFILSDKAIDRLDKLANKYDLKRASILEILLQMESEKSLYIAEKIKILKGIEE